MLVQKVHDPVEEIPMGETVGLDSTIQKVQICIDRKQNIGNYWIIWNWGCWKDYPSLKNKQ